MLGSRLLLSVAVALAAGRSASAEPIAPPRKAQPPRVQFQPAELVPPPGMMFRPGAESHGPAPGEEQMPDVRPWLLGGGKLPQPPKDIDPKVLKDLMDKVGKLPKDQQPDPKQIEKLLKDNPQFKDPAFLKQLEKLLGDPDFPNNLDKKFPKVDGPPIEDGEGLKQKLGQLVEQGKQDPDNLVPKDPKLDPKLDPDNPDLPKLPEEAKPPAAENEWVKWLEKNFKDSPAAEAAAKDLMAALEKQNAKGMFDDLPEFKSGAWKDINSWGKSNAPDLWKVKPPDLGGNKFTAPKIGGGGGGSPSWGGGGGGTPSAPSGAGLEGGGTALAVIAGIVGAVILAVLLARKWKLDRGQQAAATLAAGSPIDFDAICTREELVKVFDAVSLSRCGQEARNWNHRVIADQIGGGQPAHAGPADEVAGLYERARYAPLDEDLTPGEFASARQDLKVIAGAVA